MSWEELDKKAADNKEQRAKAAALAKNYAATFATEPGKAVLEHLINAFIMDSDTNLNAANINYEAAYRNGEAGVIKYIINQIKRAQTL